MTAEELGLLATSLAQLVRDGLVPRSQWPVAAGPPERFGLLTDAAGDAIRHAGALDLLEPEAIRRELSARAEAWLRSLSCELVTGSTNGNLMALSATESIAGHVHLAELQVQGRGRRGRGWFSPFAGNLALSLGLRIERPVGELGGASLVVGLAVLDALEQCNVADVALKWPNDVLLAGAKLGGILIEIVPGGGRFTELVVGIGLNVRIPQAIRVELDQSVADLASAASGVPVSRSQLAARIVSSVVDFVAGYEVTGFEPFRSVFDDKHFYQGQACCLSRSGSAFTEGQVMGVSGQGGLLLRTDAGVEEFHGGEISLRPLR